MVADPISDPISDAIPNLVAIYGVDTARVMLLQVLRTQPNVAGAGISEDGETIWIVFSNGLTGGLSINNPPGTLSYPSTNTGAVFSPILWAEQELVLVNARLEEDTCVAPAPIRRGAEVTVDFLKTLPDYGFISMATHGNLWKGDVVFQSGEIATTFRRVPLSHLIDWYKERIFISNDSFWMIKPSFISYYARTRKYPNSIILLSMCHSLDNSSLSSAFTSNGAGTVFGWQYSVTERFARETKESLLSQMIDDGRNTGEAYAAVAHSDPYDATCIENTSSCDPSNPPTGCTCRRAAFQMSGRGDLELPTNLVANGSFETATLSNWTQGFVFGCDFPGYGTPSGYATVISEHPTDGSYALRLGRWDQVYTGGLLGPPAPGTEPCGYDLVYQDVTIPTGSNLTLSFDYQIETYDTNVWDWFDAQIRNPATGAVLATVVSRDGKPGYDYGQHWDSGPKQAVYDLSALAGQTVRLWFGNRQDGWGDQNAVWIDNVIIGCE